jgi:type VI secretion system protein ImpK
MNDNPFAEPDDDDRTIVRSVARSVPEDPHTLPSDATVIATLAPRRPVTRTPRVEPVALAVHVGTPLARAAAPLLQVLARLHNTLTPPDSGDLRERTAAAIRVFERDARAGGFPEELLRPAHYALCASLDDVVLNTPWGSQGSWASRSLISSFHNEVRSGERFFDILKHLQQNPAKTLPVLEIMYVCLSLGFMGRYRLSPRGPAEIDRLREYLYAAIAAVRPRAGPDLSADWRGVEARYRPISRRVPFWVAGCGGLGVLGGLFVWLSLGLNTASDAAFELALQVPPVTMPAIARSAPTAPMTSAPSSESGVLDQLKQFLHPEIQAGLVDVLGTNAAPVVRLHQVGLFDAGSAVVLAKSIPVLQRIGAALKNEPGSVQILGYTDNQPIRTARFPSNFQLSAARAEAAATILGTTLGDRSRLSAEGRADADPIAANATPEGRAANRRIEIILHRQG